MSVRAFFRQLFKMNRNFSISNAQGRKRQPIEKEKIFANYVSNKGLVTRGHTAQ